MTNLSREVVVAILASILLVFTAWAWGGVVLWTQWVTAGLGLLALVIALLPSTPEKWQSRTLRRRLAFSITGGMAALLFSLVRRLLELRDLRASTLELIPGADLPPLAFADWGEAPHLIGLSTTLFLALLTGLARPSGARRRLVRFPIFWLGLFIFAWISCQSLNPWGKVILRDLFWSIIPQDHITWLPAGLDAPFGDTGEPPGMNGWRQMLILIGPWAMLCALVIAVERQRVYAWIAGLASVNAIGVLVAGHLTLKAKQMSFMGYAPAWAYHSPFGPFVYRNHAGIFLYLAAGLSLAAAFYLMMRKGERAERGGPHLIFAVLALVLAAGSVTTLSVGASAGALFVLLLAPMAYRRDLKLRQAATPWVGLVILAFGAVLFYSFGGLDYARRQWQRAESKIERLAEGVGDDRVLLRRAALEQIASSTPARLVGGWGAGSYRWTSPSFLLRQPEFRNAEGELLARANHAHNDWLQAFMEWGLLVSCAVFLALACLASCLVEAVRRGSAHLFVLVLTIIFLAFHLTLDFALHFTPLLMLAALMLAWILSGTSRRETLPL